MLPITNEWVEKAEADWATAERELRVCERANYDGVCFHAQQCAEKYLKAYLAEATIRFPHTHNLVALLTLASPMEPSWTSLDADLRGLNLYAVVVRYPGMSATFDEAHDAVESCRRIRRQARWALGLGTAEPTA
jgi:HEPN domain-containing protein